MQNVNWRMVVEASSALAILAGLVFVGLQMRQDQAISTAELQQEMISSRLSLSELSVNTSELLQRANAGDELSESEKIELDALVLAHWSWAFFGQRRWEAVDHSAINAPVRYFAVFLNENPGALTAWRSRQEKNSRARESLGMPGLTLDEFDMQVDSYLSVLEESEPHATE